MITRLRNGHIRIEIWRGTARFVITFHSYECFAQWKKAVRARGWDV